MRDWTVLMYTGATPRPMATLSNCELLVLEMMTRIDQVDIDHEGGKEAVLDRIKLERMIRSQS